LAVAVEQQNQVGEVVTVQIDFLISCGQKWWQPHKPHKPRMAGATLVHIRLG
jgi:hypothetical protein